MIHTVSRGRKELRCYSSESVVLLVTESWEGGARGLGGDSGIQVLWGQCRLQGIRTHWAQEGPEAFPELLKDVRVFPGDSGPGLTRHCAPGCGGREGGAQPRADLPPASVLVSAHWLPYGSATCSLKSLFLCPGTCGHWPQHPRICFQ